MEKITVYTNDNLKENLKILQENGYKYIVKCCDKFLSGWGAAENRKHIHLIACKDIKEREGVLNDVKNDKYMSYVNWCGINNYENIKSWTRGKSWVLRNDWTRWEN